MFCFILLSDHILTVTSFHRLHPSENLSKNFFCFLRHRTCSQLWSKAQLVLPTRTVCSCLTSSCQTSTQLCRLCFATCRSAAVASTPTCTTTARSVSVCWAPGLARWVRVYRLMYVQIWCLIDFKEIVTTFWLRWCLSSVFSSLSSDSTAMHVCLLLLGSLTNQTAVACSVH